MQDFVIAGAGAAGSRLSLSGPPYYEQFQVGASQQQEHPVRQFADGGAGVVRHARGWTGAGVAMGHGHTACTDKCMNLLDSLVDDVAQQKIVC